MTLQIDTFVLGPIENNTYLISDRSTNQAVLIDPAAPSKKISDFISLNDLVLKEVWITHAHFDHIGGVRWFLDQNKGFIKAAIHKNAFELWKNGGSARDFGFEFDPGPYPEMILVDNDILTVGKYQFKVLYTPGHTPGDITFYCSEESAAFCGDLIFYHGVGRTDFTISSTDDLMDSITKKILSLPDETRLYPGHGQYTTVGEEKINNPYL
ncbi:MAG: MBL fold metallo-hydrolase [Pelolinea sp.]|nr:MBL fold metallo-hydrolase [Pelolinea sp.]